MRMRALRQAHNVAINRRLFGKLEKIRVLASPGRTDLRFRVVKHKGEIS